MNDQSNQNDAAQPAGNSTKNVFMIFAVVLILGVAAVGYTNMNSNNSSNPSTNPTNSDTEMMQPAQGTSEVTGLEQPSTQQGADSELAAAYVDGEYAVRGSYRSPAGPEEIDVTLTLTNGEITEIDVVSLATNPGSKKYQSQFVEGYKPLVLGKNIDEIELDVVAGSSLTPKGFNEALQKIKQQARS